MDMQSDRQMVFTLLLVRQCHYLDSFGWMSLLRLSLDTEWMSKVFCQLLPEDTHTQSVSQAAC